MTEKTYPMSVGELAADRHWMSRIRTMVQRFRLHDPVEDVVGDILLLMLSREDPDGKNRDYVQRWDPGSTGSYGNWVMTFVRNFCIKRLDRSRTPGGRAIEYAASIRERQSEDDRATSGVVYSDSIPSRVDLFSAVDVIETCHHVANELRVSSPPSSWVVYEDQGYWVCSKTTEPKFTKCPVDTRLIGRTVKRDAATVLLGLMCGMEAEDLSQLMKTSRQFVYTLCRKVRQNEELLSLRES